MTPVTAPMMTTSIRARCMNAYCIGSVNQSTTFITRPLLPALPGRLIHSTRNSSDPSRSLVRVLRVVPAHVLVVMLVVCGVIDVVRVRQRWRAGGAEDDHRPAEGLSHVLGRVGVLYRAVADHALVDAAQAIAGAAGRS